MSDIKTVVIGADGRMGRMLVRHVLTDPLLSLHGGTEAPGHPAIGRDLGVLAGLEPAGVPLTDDPLDLVRAADAVIDFTVPENSVLVAGLCAQARIVHVLGTTGFSPAEEKALSAAARHATIVRSGNFSVGVNLLALLAERLAAALDDGFDAEIIEMHHRLKADAPSGTALLLAEAVARGRGIDLAANTAKARDGKTGARPPGAIGLSSVRGGSVVGEHTLMFVGEDERIEIVHKAGDRSIFARGAVRAAKWGQGRGPGLFSMADVLGFTPGRGL